MQRRPGMRLNESVMEQVEKKALILDAGKRPEVMLCLRMRKQVWIGAPGFGTHSGDFSEWRLNTAARVKSGDSDLYALLSDLRYAFPKNSLMETIRLNFTTGRTLQWIDHDGCDFIGTTDCHLGTGITLTR